MNKNALSSNYFYLGVEIAIEIGFPIGERFLAILIFLIFLFSSFALQFFQRPSVINTRSMHLVMRIIIYRAPFAMQYTYALITLQEASTAWYLGNVLTT